MKKLFLFLLVGVFLISFVHGAEFTPIFCNDYEFTCCGGKVESTQSYPITDESAWTCPSYAYKCKVLSVSDGKGWYVGSGNCHLETGFCDKWGCDIQDTSKVEMNPDEQIYLDGACLNPSASAEIKIIKKFLGFCGESGSVGEEVTCGVKVSGSDSCTFQPNDGTIYTSTDSLSGKETVGSYPVPMSECILAFQSGNRHICGYKEESCSTSGDCGGHTYGNKECIGRTLQTYGCTSYGTQIDEYDRGPFSSGWGSDKQSPTESGEADFGKRCEIISNEQVQCCGDTDCGSKMFCDNTGTNPTFTCKEEIECAQDSDCGTSIQCDWTTNILKRPTCENRKCNHEEINVECCIDKACSEGYFCNENYECEESVGTKSSCPYECCSDEERYIERLCSNNEICCPNNLCASSLSECETSITKKSESSSSFDDITSKFKGTKSSSTGIIILIIFLILIGGSIGFFFYTKNKKKIKSKPKEKKEIKKEVPKGKFCPKCGGTLREKSRFCTKCGKKI